MRLLALASVLSLSLIACGARSGLDLSADASPSPDQAPQPDDAPPLGLSAAFYVAHGADGSTTANGVFWAGDRRPMPGGTGGRAHRLAAGESVSVNGVALDGGFADWGYTYQGGAVPVRPDGVWEFRFVIAGRVITRTITLRPVRWVDFPTAPVSIGAGVTLRWAPALPEAATRRAYLTSCVLNERTETSVSSATFYGRLSAMPCRSHGQVYGTLEVPLGAPFRSGSLSASTALDRELDVSP